MASAVTFFTSDMDKVREEVRALQEQRATVLMKEIAELQKERDIASATIRKLQRTVLDTQLENAALEQCCQESSNYIATLERSLMEEQLIAADLRRKIDSHEKSCDAQVKTDHSKCKEIGSPILRKISALHQNEFISPTPKTNISRNSKSHTSLGAIDAPKSATNLFPRTKRVQSAFQLERYVLATAQVKSTSSQTEENCTNHANYLLPRTTVEESSAKQLLGLAQGLSEVEKLKQEKMIIEKELDGSKYEVYCRTQYQSLKDECRSLQAELGEISKVVKNNLQKFEDDLDVCKVIYTLHGSLSKENTVLEDMRKRLKESEKRCEELGTNCSQLAKILSEKEKELKKCLNWIQKHLSQRRSQHHVSEKHNETLGRKHTLNIGV